MILRKTFNHGRIKYVDENDKSYELFLEYDVEVEKYCCCVKKDNLFVRFYGNDKPFDEEDLYDKYFLPAKAAIKTYIKNKEEPFNLQDAIDIVNTARPFPTSMKL